MHQADTTMSFGFGALSGDPESFQRDAEQIRQFEEELRRRLEQEAKDEAAQAAARDATIAVFNVNPKLAVFITSTTLWLCSRLARIQRAREGTTSSEPIQRTRFRLSSLPRKM